MSLLAAMLVVLATWVWARAPGHLGAGGPRARRPAPGREREAAGAASSREGATAGLLRRAGLLRGSGLLRRPGRPADAELLAAVDALAPALEAGLPVPLAVEVALSQVRDPSVWQFLSGLAETDAPAVASSSPAPAPGVGNGGPGRSGPPPAAPGPGAELLERAWRLCHDLGAPLSEATRTVSALIRAERSRSREVAAALAEARATVRVLLFLPLLGPALAAAIGVPPGDLYGSAASIASGLAGLALLLVGRWWMGRLVLRVGDSPRLR